MFSNKDNKIIYSRIAQLDEYPSHQFDLFITKEILEEISIWCNNNDATWCLYEPMGNKFKINNLSFTSEVDSIWLWLFIKEENIASHFQLAWGECNI